MAPAMRPTLRSEWNQSSAPNARAEQRQTLHGNVQTIEGMCAATYKQEPNHYPPRPQTASTETSLATSMRVLNLGPSVGTDIRPASGKRRITRGPSEGDGVISYNFAGGLRTSSQVCPQNSPSPHTARAVRDTDSLPLTVWARCDGMGSLRM